MTIADPSLGESTVFRAGKLQVYALLGTALIMPAIFLVVALTVASPHPGGPASALRVGPDYGIAPFFLPAFWLLFFCIGAVLEMRLQLVVGERGFRYFGPKGAIEVRWDQVDDIAIHWRRGVRSGPLKYLTVTFKQPLEGSSQIKMGPSITFAANWDQVRSAMLSRVQAAGGRPHSAEMPLTEALALESALGTEAATSAAKAVFSGQLGVFRPSRFFSLGAFIIGLIAFGVAAWASQPQATNPSPQDILNGTNTTWPPAAQPPSIALMVGSGLVGLLLWSYGWWNSRLGLIVDSRGFTLKRAFGPNLAVDWRSVRSVGRQAPTLTRGGGVAVEYLSLDGQPARLVIGGLKLALPSIPVLGAMDAAWKRARGE
jgi:hypothetical protein